MALVFSACSLGPVSAAAPGFSDAICPEATQYVLVVGKLSKDDPPQRIYDAAQGATDAYQRCAKTKLSNGNAEGQHYADTRGSSFAVVASRALIALNRPEDARRELELWRPLAQQVVDWRSGSVLSAVGHAPAAAADIQEDVATVSRGDHRNSAYRDSAKEIVAAIDAEVARIDASLRDRARTQGRGSPAPAPSSRP
ncbi:MAG TPA: hypothetical protein VN224_05205 [Xanthomonadales bacterium]|nr:hypothetical protein [Xanthomonadales bacterium]